MTCNTCAYLNSGNTFCCNAFHPKPVADCPDYELSEASIARIHTYIAAPYYLQGGRKFLAVELSEVTSYLPFAL